MCSCYNRIRLSKYQQGGVVDTERVNLAVYKNLPSPLVASDIDSIIITGSHAHGTVIDANDVDVACVVNPISGQALFGFTPFIQKKVKDGDIEITYISIRRLIEHLCASKITALELLFSPSSLFLKDGEAMRSIQDKRGELFSVRAIGPSLMGYAEGQFAEMDHARPDGTNSKRSLALDQYSYYTKAAAHGLRALWMCAEFFKEGCFCVDRTGIDESLLKQIKRGAFSLDDITTMVLAAQSNAKHYYERSAGTMPEQVDRVAAEELLIDISVRTTTQRYFSWTFSRGFDSGIVPGINKAQEAAEQLVSQGYRYSKSHGMGDKLGQHSYTGAYPYQESSDTDVGKMENSTDIGMGEKSDEVGVGKESDDVGVGQKSKQSAGGAESIGKEVGTIFLEGLAGIQGKSDETGWGLELNH
jgi:hypothetical protein